MMSFLFCLWVSEGAFLERKCNADFKTISRDGSFDFPNGKILRRSFCNFPVDIRCTPQYVHLKKYMDYIRNLIRSIFLAFSPCLVSFRFFFRNYLAIVRVWSIELAVKVARTEGWEGWNIIKYPPMMLCLEVSRLTRIYVRSMSAN